LKLVALDGVEIQLKPKKRRQEDSKTAPEKKKKKRLVYDLYYEQ
jgi:hypothetical protein